MARFPEPVRLLPRRIAGCCRCPRLAAYLQELRREEPAWWNRPVPGFGDPAARLLVLGLAPGRAGANRTGRPFTGDAAGRWLYRGLHELGLCSRSQVGEARDGTRLRGVYVTNVVKCVPPANRPVAGEVRECGDLLAAELARLGDLRCVLILGRVSHQALGAHVAGGRPALPAFGHGAWGRCRAAGRSLALACSFHPSRQNTNTGRLTWTMWIQVLERVRHLAGLE